MNFYKRHLGDYAKDAGHLSMLEHGAYTLLLDRYYTTERPIPSKVDAYRICRARTREEKAAVDAVLREFFVSDGEAFVNRRAEQEIARAAHQRTVNQEVGKRGGRPRKTESVSEQEPTQEPNENQTITLARLQDSTQVSKTKPEGECAQSAAPPAPPTPQPRRKPKPRETPLPEGFSLSDGVREWAERKGFDRLDEHLDAFVEKARAKGYTYADWDAAFKTAVREDWAHLRKPVGRTTMSGAQSFRERDAEVAKRTAEAWMGSLAPSCINPQPAQEVFDMEAIDATRLPNR